MGEEDDEVIDTQIDEKKTKKKKSKKDAQANGVESAAQAADADDEEEEEDAPDASSMSAEQRELATRAGWGEFGLHDELIRGLAHAGFVEPTPIQRACLPAALHGKRDVVGAAETGSGKTLAFGLPILNRLLIERQAASLVESGMAASKKAKKAKQKAAATAAAAAGSDPKRRAPSTEARDAPFALIICPTRELANQVGDHIRAVAPADVGIVSIVGGMSPEKQRRLLSKRPEVVVGTPGRLWELASDGMVPHLSALHAVRFFVLDEVDRMVEQGHFRELHNLMRLLEQRTIDDGDGAGGDAADGLDTDLADDAAVSDDDEEEEADDDDAAMSEEEAGAVEAAKSGDDDGCAEGGTHRARQTFLFSATLMLPTLARESSASRLAKSKPVSEISTMETLMRQVQFRNSLKVVDLSRPALVPSQLQQSQLSCSREEKDAFLYLLLRTRLATGRVIVFTNAVSALQRLRSLLALLGVPVIALQGGMQQRARLKALDRFKTAAHSVLLATDVAARGLDIDGVDFVVHYQLPRSAEVYVHRSGRTARGGAHGLAIALVEPSDIRSHRRLCMELGVPSGLPELQMDAKLLPKVREIVSIARQLDKAAHAKSKASANSAMRKQLAAEMELPSDSDASDDEVDVRKRGEVDVVTAQAERRRKEEEERLRDKLKKLIARLERPSGRPVAEVAKGRAAWS